MHKILVVEDLEDSFLLIKSALSGLYELYWAKSVNEATKIYRDSYDLALIDVSLPDGSGFDFCDWVRSQKGDNALPIIFLTANDTVESRIAGFTVGGDDYISKPFNFVELKARIEAKLKKKTLSKNLYFTSCGLKLDLHAQKAITKNANGQEVDLNLTPIEFKILHLLMSDREKVFSRDEILNKIWGKDIYIYPRSVDTHVSKLRTKLNEKSGLVKSVHGVGYRFNEEDKKNQSPSEDTTRQEVLYKSQARPLNGTTC